MPIKTKDNFFYLDVALTPHFTFALYYFHFFFVNLAVHPHKVQTCFMELFEVHPCFLKRYFTLTMLIFPLCVCVCVCVAVCGCVCVYALPNSDCCAWSAHESNENH